MKRNIHKTILEHVDKSNIKHQCCAIIIHRNKILSIGINRFNYSYNKKYTIHAEENAISKIKNKTILKNCKMYLIKKTISNKIIDCNPCLNCFKILNKYKLNKIIIITQF